MANDFTARETADRQIFDDMVEQLGELLWIRLSPTGPSSNAATTPDCRCRSSKCRPRARWSRSTPQSLSVWPLWRYLHDTDEAPWLRDHP